MVRTLHIEVWRDNNKSKDNSTESDRTFKHEGRIRHHGIVVAGQSDYERQRMSRNIQEKNQIGKHERAKFAFKHCSHRKKGHKIERQMKQSRMKPSSSKYSINWDDRLIGQSIEENIFRIMITVEFIKYARGMETNSIVKPSYEVSKNLQEATYE